MFDFVKCATDDEILFNIESKVDGDFRNLTRTPEDFTKVSEGNHDWEGCSIGSLQAMVDLYTSLGPEIIDRVTHQVSILLMPFCATC
jgi:hypothetical protein